MMPIRNMIDVKTKATAMKETANATAIRTAIGTALHAVHMEKVSALMQEMVAEAEMPLKKRLDRLEIVADALIALVAPRVDDIVNDDHDDDGDVVGNGHRAMTERFIVHEYASMLKNELAMAARMTNQVGDTMRYGVEKLCAQLAFVAQWIREKDALVTTMTTNMATIDVEMEATTTKKTANLTAIGIATDTATQAAYLKQVSAMVQGLVANADAPLKTRLDRLVIVADALATLVGPCVDDVHDNDDDHDNDHDTDCFDVGNDNATSYERLMVREYASTLKNGLAKAVDIANEVGDMIRNGVDAVHGELVWTADWARHKEALVTTMTTNVATIDFEMKATTTKTTANLTAIGIAIDTATQAAYLKQVSAMVQGLVAKADAPLKSRLDRLVIVADALATLVEPCVDAVHDNDDDHDNDHDTDSFDVGNDNATSYDHLMVREYASTLKNGLAKAVDIANEVGDMIRNGVDALHGELVWTADWARHKEALTTTMTTNMATIDVEMKATTTKKTANLTAIGIATDTATQAAYLKQVSAMVQGLVANADAPLKTRLDRLVIVADALATLVGPCVDAVHDNDDDHDTDSFDVGNDNATSYERFMVREYASTLKNGLAKAVDIAKEVGDMTRNGVDAVHGELVWTADWARHKEALVTTMTTNVATIDVEMKATTTKETADTTTAAAAAPDRKALLTAMQ